MTAAPAALSGKARPFLRFGWRASPGSRASRDYIALHGLALALPLFRLPESLTQALVIAAITSLYLLALWLLGAGLRAESGEAPSSAPATRLPLKTVSAVIMGLAVAAAFASNGTALPATLLCGGLAFGLHLLAFGLDGRNPYAADDMAHDMAEDPATAPPPDQADHRSATDSDPTSARPSANETATDPARAELGRIQAALAPCDDAAIRAATADLARAIHSLAASLGPDPADRPFARRALALWLPALADAADHFAPRDAARPDPARRSELAATLARVAARLDDLVA
ncbi:hypothetical protein G5V65_13435 [Rhodobacter sp. HX-7-19]|uniref:Uncharacterized protein n=1 Tax=Paragemmobacter kunshanensis TaxID=2583234 RepID=A0A6M1UAE4_9RHOB|nr:hypothetical protein [Rhodobacter kunshanensis]NGQ91901.1 hypothetical protein [Rhodobacter kunshanensis]